MTKKQVLIDNLKEMEKYGDITFSKLVREALTTIIPSKIRIIVIIVILLTLEYPLIMVVKSTSTVEDFMKIIEFTNGIILGIFAIIFTGYALFQALINKNTLKVMFVTKKKNKYNYNMFIEYNLYFFMFSLLCIISIIINNLIIVYLIGFSKYIFNFINDEFFKNSISLIFINVYFSFNLFIVLEAKSFILNLFQCFNISAISTMIDNLSNYDEDLHEKNSK